MIYKYLFYFISWFNKKVDILKGTDEYCYYAASALVGLTLAVNLYIVMNIFSIVLLKSNDTYRTISLVMDIICFIMSIITFLYFRHNNRWEIIYKEIRQSFSAKKKIYGIRCLLYVLLTYGLWFFTNDVIRVLKTGDGMSFAIKIANLMNLTNW